MSKKSIKYQVDHSTHNIYIIQIKVYGYSVKISFLQVPSAGVYLKPLGNSRNSTRREAKAPNVSLRKATLNFFVNKAKRNKPVIVFSPTSLFAGFAVFNRSKEWAFYYNSVFRVLQTHIRIVMQKHQSILWYDYYYFYFYYCHYYYYWYYYYYLVTYLLLLHTLTTCTNICKKHCCLFHMLCTTTYLKTHTKTNKQTTLEELNKETIFRNV